MSRLEEELRQALRREEPPGGFAERVLARAAARSARRGRWTSWLHLPWPAQLRWVAAAAAMLVMTFSGFEYYQQRQARVRGEQAKEQVMLALRIAAGELQFTRQKVRQHISGDIQTLPQGSGQGERE
jgi:hypothetical protein